jgi:hypothetical protein
LGILVSVTEVATVEEEEGEEDDEADDTSGVSANFKTGRRKG